MRLYTRTSIVALASLALLVVPQARAGSDNSSSQRGQFSKDDYKFACEAARGGLFEVKAGELARTQGMNPTVKQFGERMVKDHSQINARLTALAARKAAVLPTSLKAKEKDQLKSLDQLAGKDFDKTYAKSMVKDHENVIKAFQREAEKAEDPDLKAFAANTVPILQQHLDMAKQMQSAVEREGQTAGP